MEDPGYMTHTQALGRALELANELHETIRIVRAEAGRDDLIDAIRQVQGPISFLMDELTASRLSKEGSRLCWAADEVNRDSLMVESSNGDQAYISSFEADMRYTSEVEPDALDFDLQELAKHFDESWDSESFHNRASNLRTSVARRAAKLISKHYVSLKN